MAKSAQMKLRDQADKLAGEECRARGYCQAMGLDSVTCKGVLQWAHIVERSEHSLRWNPYNCLSLCQGHHLYYTYRPLRWVLFIMKHFPREWRYIRKHIDDGFDYNYERLIKELGEV